MRKLLIVMVLTAVALPVIGFAAFGPPDDLEFSEYASPPSAAVQEDWFGHIGVKVLLLGASLLVAVFLSKRFFTNRRLRKVYLLINVAVLGFAVGGMLCPISAIQNIFIKYNTVYLLLFFLPILSTLLFGRVYCGWVCPFGAVSEWLFVKKWAVRIPKKWDRFLKWTRWGVLVFLVGRILLGAHVADDWTPFKNLFTFGGSLTNWILTGAFLGLSIISYRPFCKYLCVRTERLCLLLAVSAFERSHSTIHAFAADNARNNVACKRWKYRAIRMEIASFAANALLLAGDHRSQSPRNRNRNVLKRKKS